MRTIGLLGGMSWESTAVYYQLINEGVRQRLGGLHSAHCLLYSVDFAEVEALMAAGQWDEAGRLLAEAAAKLEHAGAELLLLCTNTFHKVADAITTAVDVDLLHIVDVTATAVRAAGIDSVGLLGTSFTMEEEFYTARLASHGLTVRVPGPDDRALVHKVIFDELCRGVVSDASRQSYREVISRLVDAGAQGVILGCTEIELLVGPDDSPVPIFPTTRLHADAAVARALADA